MTHSTIPNSEEKASTCARRAGAVGDALSYKGGFHKDSVLGEALGQGGEWRRRGLDHRENGTYLHFRVPWRGWRATATESRVSQRQSVRRPQRSAVPAVSSKLAATRRCRRHLRPNRRLAENVPTVFRPWQTAAKGQTPPGYPHTWRNRFPLRSGTQRSNQRLVFTSQPHSVFLAATGQNGGAQPPPHACHKDVMRLRARARQAELWKEVGRGGWD